MLKNKCFFRGILYPPHEINQMYYDFSLSAGDTFNINNKILEVALVDTVYYSNIPRKRLTIKEYPADSTYYIATWIEGIGNPEGILNLSFPNATMLEMFSHIRCYIYNGELLYSNYKYGAEDCITPLVSLENISLNDNSIGQRVYQSVVNSKEKVIDISSFVNGVYILGVNTENGVIRKKIIKN